MSYELKTKRVKGVLRKADPGEGSIEGEQWDLVFEVNDGPTDLQTGAKITHVFYEMEEALNQFSKKDVIAAITGERVETSAEVEYYDWED